MPKNLLPSLTELLNKVLKKPSNPTEILTESGLLETPQDEPYLNLLGEGSVSKYDFNRINLIIRFLIIGILCVFIFLYFWNEVLTVQLNTSKALTEERVKKYQVFNSVKDTVLELTQRSALFGQVYATRSKVKEKVLFVFAPEEENSDIRIKHVTVSPEKFEVTAESDSAMVFAKLVDTYTKDKKIQELILKSATLTKTKDKGSDRERQFFLVELEGKF